MTMHCKGCGALLQTENEQEVGYVINIEQPFCQSCYRLMHYGEVNAHFHPQDLPQLGRNAVAVMMSSVLHLDMLFQYPVYRFEPDLKYVYIINQIDLLPKQTNLDELLKRIIAKAKALKIPYYDIILMSAKNPLDIANLKTYLATFKEPNVYLLGVQNSGKTTVYKALTDNEEALAFTKAGLTQEPFSAKVGYQMIWDMPGLYQEGYIHQFLPYEDYKKLIPTQTIKPRIYQLKKGQALILKGLLAIQNMKTDTSLVLYLSPFVKIHKTRIERIEALLKKDPTLLPLEAYEEKAFKIGEKKTQITFADIGFLHTEKTNTLSFIIPNKMHLTLTEALFK